MQDYTVNDAFKEGFECGVAYILRYAHEERDVEITDKDIVILGEHLWNHKPWRDSPSWSEFIYNSVRKKTRTEQPL